MYQSKTYNAIYVLVLFLLLFLSFNPTESVGSNLAIYMRLVPFFIFLLFIVINNLSVKVSLLQLSLVLFTCILIFVMKINSLTERLVFQLMPIILSFFVINILNNNSNERKVFENILTMLIVVWMISLFIQLILYYFFGVVIEIHNMVFKASEARGVVNQDVLRFGGLQIEPGTYSNWLFGVIVLRSFLVKKISTPLHWIAALSMLFTLSFWAYIAFLFFLIASLFENKNILRIWALVAVTVVCFTLYMYIGDSYSSYILSRAKLSTATATGKIHVFSYVFNNIEEWLILGASFSLEPCDICYSPQDAGVGINLIYYFGFLMIFIFVLFLIKTVSFFGIKGLFLITPIFLAKYYYWDPITIMILMFVLFYSYGVRAPRIFDYLINNFKRPEKRAAVEKSVHKKVRVQ